MHAVITVHHITIVNQDWYYAILDLDYSERLEVDRPLLKTLVFG